MCVCVCVCACVRVRAKPHTKTLGGGMREDFREEGREGGRKRRKEGRPGNTFKFSLIDNIFTWHYDPLSATVPLEMKCQISPQCLFKQCQQRHKQVGDGTNFPHLALYIPLSISLWHSPLSPPRLALHVPLSISLWHSLFPLTPFPSVGTLLGTDVASPHTCWVFKIMLVAGVNLRFFDDN